MILSRGMICFLLRKVENLVTNGILCTYKGPTALEFCFDLLINLKWNMLRMQVRNPLLQQRKRGYQQDVQKFRLTSLQLESFAVGVYLQGGRTGPNCPEVQKSYQILLIS